MAQFSMEIMRLTGSVLRGNQQELIRRLLVDHAAALRQKSTPEQTVRAALLALS
jgi:hypothetical protein